MKVSLITLGCKVNQYESEAIAEALAVHGFEAVPFGERADVTIINTCTVTTEGERKARQMVRRAIAVSPDAYIVVTGCAAQLNPGSFSAIEGVDAVVGNGKKMETVACILRHFKEKEDALLCPDDSFNLDTFEPMSIEKSERTRAYIKIEDGCDSHCAYCSIRKARGKVRSKPVEDVVAEACRLVESGYRELVLTGIEISAYGKDLGYDLLTLLERLDAIPNMARLRLGSLDPSMMKDEIISRLAKLEKLCRHFHLSLQSGCSATLAAMKRKNNAPFAENAMEKLRAAMPDATFTADIIVGFPGESEEDFQETAAFLNRVNLLDCHIFAFSPRPDTEAATMKGQIHGEVKAEREKRLSAICKETQRRVLESFLHTKAEVLFEEAVDGYAIGHTANYIEVRLKTEEDLHNTLKTVTLTAIDGSSMMAE